MDVAKDPYILKLIYSEKVVGTFMLLTRLGVPLKTIGYFMNQPIIRDLVKQAELQGKGLFGQNLHDQILTGYPANKPTKGLQTNNDLKDNIGKTNQGEGFNAHQQRVLMEFLKYSKLAEKQLTFTNAYTYDTTKFRGPEDIFKKNIREAIALYTNPIQGLSKIIDNSHIGEISTQLSRFREATSSIFKFEEPQIRSIVETLLTPLASNPYLGAEDYRAAAIKITSSLIDHVVQTDGSINNLIAEYVANNQTSTAHKLIDYQKEANANPILKELIPQIEQGISIVKLKVKPRDAYDKNLYTGYLRELEETNPEFYNQLVNQAIIQGSFTSPSSFLEIIPIESYSKIVKPLIDNILGSTNLQSFLENKLFEKNNWNDTDIVPRMEPFYNYEDERDEHNQPTGDSTFINRNYLAKIFSRGEVIVVTDKYNNDILSNDLITVPVLAKKFNTRNFTESEKKQYKNLVGHEFPGYNKVYTGSIAEANKKGDTRFKNVIGYQKVYNSNGEPLHTSYTSKGEVVNQYYYKQVNLLGSKDLSEYYTDERPSPLNNNTVKVENVLNDQDIINKVLSNNKDKYQQVDSFESFKESLKRVNC